MASITLVGEMSEKHPLFGFPIGVDVDELFDVYGSDAVAHDERDPEHNYWVDVNECSDDVIPEEFVEEVDADDYYADVFSQLVEAGLAKKDEKDFYLDSDANDDEVLTSTCVPGTITWTHFFDDDDMVPVKVGIINASVRKPVVVDPNVRGGKKGKKFVWKRVEFAVEVVVRKHRHVDQKLAVMEFLRRTEPGPVLAV